MGGVEGADLRFDAVLCAGDIAAQGGGSFNLPASQATAWQEGFSVVTQSGKPFVCASGKHDNEQNTPGWYTYSFDENVGHAKIAGAPWYAGVWQAGCDQAACCCGERRRFEVFALRLLQKTKSCATNGTLPNRQPSNKGC